MLIPGPALSHYYIIAQHYQKYLSFQITDKHTMKLDKWTCLESRKWATRPGWPQMCCQTNHENQNYGIRDFQGWNWNRKAACHVEKAAMRGKYLRNMMLYELITQNFQHASQENWINYCMGEKWVLQWVHMRWTNSIGIWWQTQLRSSLKSN